MTDSTPGHAPATTGRAPFGHSFWADLRRFDAVPTGCSLLAAMAASVRHNHAAVMHLWHGEQVINLKVYPRERLVHSTVELAGLPPAELARLHFAHAEGIAPLSGHEPLAEDQARSALGPWLWALALHGNTEALLPEIAGPARYRLAPAPHLDALPLSPEMQGLLAGMRGRPVSAQGLAAAVGWPLPQVHRFLNALYLQSALMVTRLHDASR